MESSNHGLLSSISFKSAVVEKLSLVETSLARIAKKVGVPQQPPDEADSDTSLLSQPTINDADIPYMPSRAQQTWDVTLEGESVVPGACVVETSTPDQSSIHKSPMIAGKSLDVVAKGLISQKQALQLFDIYRSRLDHFLYRILGDHESLESVRAGSPLLVAAICTVGALHAVADDALSSAYQTCYDELLALSARQTFAKHNNVDDIRGLCIGAFWLCDISWNLVGLGNVASRSSCVST